MDYFGNKDFFDPFTKCCGEVPQSGTRCCVPTVCVPPTIELSAGESGDSLLINAGVDGLIYPEYIIIYRVNNTIVASQLVTEDGSYPKLVPIRDGWIDSELTITATVSSLSPSPECSATEEYVITITCVPPTIVLSAEIVEDDLEISLAVSDLVYSSYAVYYMVNDVVFASIIITEAGSYPQTIPMQPEWFTGPFVVSVQIDSIPPSPVCSDTQQTLVLFVCEPPGGGMPEGDFVFEITEQEYLEWTNRGIWRCNWGASGGETHTYNGGGGDIYSSPPGSFDEIETDLSCEFSSIFPSFPETTTYFGYPYSGVVHTTVDLEVYLKLGIVAGSYYAGVTLFIGSPGGLCGDSGPIPGNGLGTFLVTIGGYSVPMQVRWLLLYSNPPYNDPPTSIYTNDIVFSFDMIREPI